MFFHFYAKQSFLCHSFNRHFVETIKKYCYPREMHILKNSRPFMPPYISLAFSKSKLFLIVLNQNYQVAPSTNNLSSPEALSPWVAIGENMTLEAFISDR